MKQIAHNDWFIGRRPIISIDTPCLLREFVVRPTAELQRRDTYFNNLFIEKLNSFMEELDLFIDGIEHPYDATDDEDRFSSKMFAIDSKSGIPLRITMDTYSEHAYLQVRSYPLKARANSGKNIDEILKGDSSIARICRYLYEVSIADKSNKHEEPAEYNNLINEFWEENTRFGKKDFRKLRSISMSGDIPHTAPDVAIELVGVFSGVILSKHKREDFEKNIKSKTVEENMKADAMQLFANNVKEDYGVVAKGAISSATYKDHLATEFLSNIRHIDERFPLYAPLLHSEDLSEVVENAAGSVICGFYGGVAIFGANFIRPNRTPQINCDSTWSDVNFFILYSGGSRQQLSILTNILIRCGVCRLFIQPDYLDFRKAAYELRKIRAEVDKETLDESFDFYKVLLMRSRINQANSLVRGGVQNSVERAKYYGAILDQLLESLRVVRVKGRQTYSELLKSAYSPQVLNYVKTGELLNDIELKISRAEEQVENMLIKNIGNITTIIVIGTLMAGLFAHEFDVGITSFDFMGMPFSTPEFRKGFVQFVTVFCLLPGCWTLIRNIRGRWKYRKHKEKQKFKIL